MNRKFSMAILAAMVLTVSPLLHAEDNGASKNPLSVDVATDFVTDYMFRGQQLYDGTSIQPSITATWDSDKFGSFSGNLWGHLSAESDKTHKNFTELDETISYAYDFADTAQFSIAHAWYTYPDKSDDISATSEMIASFALHTELSPVLTYAYDYDEFDSSYFELGLSHEIKGCLGEGFNTTPYVKVGFASGAEKVYANDGLVHTTIGTTSEVALGDIAVVPSLNYTFESDATAKNEFWGGLSLRYGF